MVAAVSICTLSFITSWTTSQCHYGTTNSVD